MDIWPVRFLSFPRQDGGTHTNPRIQRFTRPARQTSRSFPERNSSIRSLLGPVYLAAAISSRTRLPPMLGARACRLSAETGASSSANQSTRKGEGSVAKWSSTELMHRWKILTLKMMTVIRVYAIKMQAQAVLGRDNYLRVIADVRDQDHTTRAQTSSTMRIIGGYLVGTPLSRGKGLARLSPDQCNHPIRIDETERKQEPAMVHVHAVSGTLGTERPEPPGKGPEPVGLGGIRNVLPHDLRGSDPISSEVLRLGSRDNGTGGGLLTVAGQVRHVSAPGTTPPDTDAGGRDGHGEQPHQTARAVNRLVQGSVLSRLLRLPLLGYVGHLVSQVPTKDLTGPVLGDRVAIYYSDREEGPWQLASQETRLESSGNPGVQGSHKLVLYRPVSGAFEGSSEDSADQVKTVPHAVLKQIKGKLNPKAVSWSLPMEIIAEEPGESEDTHLLPEEHIDDAEAVPLDSDDEEPSPASPYTPTEAQLRDLKMAHDNSGHPSNMDFARLLRRGNVKPEIAAWVRHNFKCEACQAHAMPKARRPTAVPKTFRVNHVVGLDLVDNKDLQGERRYWLNAICWGSSFQLVGKLRGDGRKTPENVWNTFVHVWIRVFGVPELVVVDPGMEFTAHFTEMLSAYGGIALPTDARSPWQNGRTERAGKEWKNTSSSLAAATSPPRTRNSRHSENCAAASATATTTAQVFHLCSGFLVSLIDYHALSSATTPLIRSTSRRILWTTSVERKN